MLDINYEPGIGFGNTTITTSLGESPYSWNSCLPVCNFKIDIITVSYKYNDNE